MTKMIGSLIENDFVTLLTDDITGFLSKVVDPKEESRKWANSLLFPPTGSKPILDAHQLQGEILSKEETMKMEDLKIKLKSLMMGLLRMERLGPALQAYRDRLLKIVKNATKQVQSFLL